MFSKLRKTLLILLAALLVPAGSFAGTNGKVTGTVKDKETGDPLPGVNVIIQGTTMGAATDDNGEFLIISVPAGVYTVNANMIGYSVLKRTNVRVLPDFTTRLTFDLVAEDIGGEEVVIVAERPLLQKDQTMTLSVTSADEIKALPVRGFQDAANLGVGFISYNFDAASRNLGNDGGTGNVSVRGGRPNETGVFVDGFLQNDLITGTNSNRIANSAIEEVVVITGGFSAEFGRNQSGVIQVVTKSGGSNYSGIIEGVTDAGIGSALANDYGYKILSGSLGGPLIPGSDKVKFFVSAEGENWDDIEPAALGFPKYTLSDAGVGSAQAGVADTVIFSTNSDGSPKFKDGARPDNFSDNGANSRKSLSLQSKFTVHVTPTFKLDFQGNFSKTWRRNFTNDYSLNLDHVTLRSIDNLNVGAVGTYTLNERSFLDVGINFYDFERSVEDGHVKGDLAAYGAGVLGNTGFSHYNNNNLFRDLDRVNQTFTLDEDQYYAVKANYVNQLNRNHQLKIGVDFFRHEVRFLRLNDLNNPGGGPAGGANDNVGFFVDPVTLKLKRVNSDDLNNKVLGATTPISSALFVRDKIEYEGFVVDAGLRFDMFNPGVKRVKDIKEPTGPNQILDASDYTSGKTFTKFSPRLSVSFPVSEKTQFRMSYGKFFQQPNLQDLYVSPDFLSRMSLTPPFASTLGNPNLEPEESTQYEVGFRRLLSEKLVFDVNAYYKDLENMINVLTQSSSPNSIILQQNNDIAIIKGMNFTLEMRRSGKFLTRVSYTLQQANGSGSASASAFRQEWLGFDNSRVIAPLNFDQRHSISGVLDIRNGKDEGPEIGGSKFLSEAGVNFLLRAGSGFPYTPTTQHPIIVNGPPSERPTGRRNSQYSPWTIQLDLKADKTIRFGGQYSANIYIEVLNVLDRLNANTVHSQTGSSRDDGFLETAGGQAFSDLKRTQYQIRLNNSLWHNTPRQARIGVLFNF